MADLSADDPLGAMLAESMNLKDDDDAWKGLTYEQEIYLKKLIIKHIIDQETKIFYDKPTIATLEKECTFLHYIYQKCLREHPLFKDKWETIKPSLDFVLEKVPRFLNLRAHNAKSRSGLVVDVFDIRVQSKQETATNPKIRTFLTDEISPPQEKEKQAEALQAPLSLLGLRRETFFLLQSLLDGVLEYGNANTIYQTILGAKKMEDLPVAYRKLLGATYVFPILMYHLGDPKALAKMKTVEGLTPVSGLKTLFTVTSAVTVFQKLFSLFLARPLGSKSLLQRFVEIALEVQKTEEKVKEKQQTMQNKDVCTKVHNWIEANFQVDLSKKVFDTPEKKVDFIKTLLMDKATKPEFDAPNVNKLTRNDFLVIFDYFHSDLKLKDKQTFVESLGDDEFVKKLEELIVVVCEPLVELTALVDMPNIIGILDKFVLKMIEIAEDKNMQDKANPLYQELLKLEEATLTTLQKVLSSEASKPAAKSIVQQITLWTAGFFDMSTFIEVNLETILNKVPENDKMAAVGEVNSWIAFKKKERALKEGSLNPSTLPSGKLRAPQQVYVPKLGPHFLAAVKENLDRVTLKQLKS